MFLRHYKLAISRIIMMVMLFATFAPTLSHAMANMAGNVAITQQVCTSTGATVVIQIKTTMGQQLATAFELKPNPSKPQTVDNHFKHCPFCANAYSSDVLPKANDLIIKALEIEAQTIAQHAVVNVVFQPYLSPPSQAPPHSL